jgi:hypothetical protein
MGEFAARDIYISKQQAWRYGAQEYHEAALLHEPRLERAEPAAPRALPSLRGVVAGGDVGFAASRAILSASAVGSHSRALSARECFPLMRH